jgi:hypothetical protein
MRTRRPIPVAMFVNGDIPSADTHSRWFYKSNKPTGDDFLFKIRCDKRSERNAWHNYFHLGDTFASLLKA